MIETIITHILAAVSGGGISWIFNVKYSRREAEADAMTKMQGVYQTLVTDLQKDREDLKRTIEEIRPRIAELEKKTEQNERMLRAAKPFLCARAAGNCPDWKNIDITQL